MTNKEFQQKANDFYEKNKPLKLIDVVMAVNGRHKCQVCGNRHLKKLCHVRNDERNEEWFVGWNCWEAVETLQEKEEKARFNEIVKCSGCGVEKRKGLMSASCPGLCRDCCCKKLNIPIPEKVNWFPEPIKEVK